MFKNQVSDDIIKEFYFASAQICLDLCDVDKVNYNVYC